MNAVGGDLQNPPYSIHVLLTQNELIEVPLSITSIIATWKEINL